MDRVGPAMSQIAISCPVHDRDRSAELTDKSDFEKKESNRAGRTFMRHKKLREKDDYGPDP